MLSLAHKHLVVSCAADGPEAGRGHARQPGTMILATEDCQAARCQAPPDQSSVISTGVSSRRTGSAPCSMKNVPCYVGAARRRHSPGTPTRSTPILLPHPARGDRRRLRRSHGPVLRLQSGLSLACCSPQRFSGLYVRGTFRDCKADARAAELPLQRGWQAGVSRIYPAPDAPSRISPMLDRARGARPPGCPRAAAVR